MHYVSDTPILIDPVDFSRASPAGGSSSKALNNPRFGPWKYGNYIYVVFSSNTDGVPGNGTLRVFKRSISGGNWTRQHQVGEPNWELSFYTPLATFNESTGIIDIFIAGELLSTGAHLFHIAFNCSTDTYGSVSTDHTYGMWPYNRDVFQFSDGSSGAITIEVNPTKGIWWQLFESGTFSTEQLILSLSPIGEYAGILSGLVDLTTDILHLFYFIYTASSPSTGGVYYLQIDRSGTPNTPTLVYNLSAAGAPAFISTSPMVYWNGDYVIALTNYNDANIQAIISVDPNTLGVTVEDWDPGDHIGDNASQYLNLYADSDNTLWMTWEVYIFGDGSAVDDQLWSNSNDGTGWGTATLVYDARLNPPPNGLDEDGSQFVHTIGVIRLPSGCWIYITALETLEIDSIFHCTGFELLICGALLGGGWKLYEA